MDEPKLSIETFKKVRFFSESVRYLTETRDNDITNPLELLKASSSFTEDFLVGSSDKEHPKCKKVTSEMRHSPVSYNKTAKNYSKSPSGFLIRCLQLH